MEELNFDTDDEYTAAPLESDSDDDDLMQDLTSRPTAKMDVSDEESDDEGSKSRRSSRKTSSVDHYVAEAASGKLPTRMRYSVDQLVKTTHMALAQVKVAEKQELINDLNTQLKESLKSGGILAEAKRDQERFEEDAKNAVLNAERQHLLDQMTVSDKIIPECPPGTAVFCNKLNLDLIDLHCELDGVTLPVLNDATSDQDTLYECVKSGFISTYFAREPMPPSIMDWLARTLIVSTDEFYTIQCSSTLEALMQVLFRAESAPQESMADETASLPGCNWTPSIAFFFQCLAAYGATQSSLRLAEVLGSAALKELGIDKIMNKGAAQKTDIPQATGDSTLPIVNLERVIRLVTLGVTEKPHMYSQLEAKVLFVVLCRMCVDARLASVEHDIGLCIGSLLELEASDKWPDMEFQLSQALPKIATHHHDLLHVVQCLPMTVRGMGLRQQAALTLLRSFCGQPASDRTTASRALPRAVCDAVQHLQVKKNKDLQDETNYYELHTILSLIDLCIINQPLNATGMKYVKLTEAKLTSLSGHIKECQGRFPDRMKVKDLIVQLRGKFAFLTTSGTVFDDKGNESTPNQKPITSYVARSLMDVDSS